MEKPKPTDPLTVEEVEAAAEIFFPLYQVVSKKMPLNARVEDVLKIMETVCQLAHKERAKSEEEKVGPFGFNKKVDDDTVEADLEKQVDMYFGSEYDNGINYDD